MRLNPNDIASLRAASVPHHVAILGMGPSLNRYVDTVKALGGRHRYSDEVWTLNDLGDVLQCDRVFAMDDVRIQQRRADARPDSNIGSMLAWMRRHPGPIYTSRAHPDYPGHVEYPLQAVLDDLGFIYFNSTAAYAVAYAVHIGVAKMSLFGFDFTYPDHRKAEKGRACVEFWLGVARARGVELAVSERSTLLDMGDSQLYGYDTMAVSIDTGQISMEPLADWPSADDIERRYCHDVMEPATKFEILGS